MQTAPIKYYLVVWPTGRKIVLHGPNLEEAALSFGTSRGALIGMGCITTEVSKIEIESTYKGEEQWRI